jgi:hypothetical protein
MSRGFFLTVGFVTLALFVNQVTGASANGRVVVQIVANPAGQRLWQTP